MSSFWAVAAFVSKDEGLIIEWSDAAVATRMECNGNYPEDVFYDISFPKDMQFPAVVMLDIETDYDNVLAARTRKIIWQGKE